MKSSQLPNTVGNRLSYVYTLDASHLYYISRPNFAPSPLGSSGGPNALLDDGVIELRDVVDLDADALGYALHHVRRDAINHDGALVPGGWIGGRVSARRAEAAGRASACSTAGGRRAPESATQADDHDRAVELDQRDSASDADIARGRVGTEDGAERLLAVLKNLRCTVDSEVRPSSASLSRIARARTDWTFSSVRTREASPIDGRTHLRAGACARGAPMGEYAAIAAATATSCAGTIAEITRVRPQMKRQARGVDRLSGASLGRLVVGVIVPAIVLLPAHRTISRRRLL